MKILCMGSVNVDKTYRVDHIPKEGETILARGFRQGWGGKGLNQAVALAKSCDEVYFAGNAGVQDAALGSFLRQHNIHDDYLNLLEDAPTGVASSTWTRTARTPSWSTAGPTRPSRKNTLTGCWAGSRQGICSSCRTRSTAWITYSAGQKRRDCRSP